MMTRQCVLHVSRMVDTLAGLIELNILKICINALSVRQYLW